MTPAGSRTSGDALAVLRLRVQYNDDVAPAAIVAPAVCSQRRRNMHELYSTAHGGPPRTGVAPYLARVCEFCAVAGKAQHEVGGFRPPGHGAKGQQSALEFGLLRITPKRWAWNRVVTWMAWFAQLRRPNADVGATREWALGIHRALTRRAKQGTWALLLAPMHLSEAKVGIAEVPWWRPDKLAERDAMAAQTASTIVAVRGPAQSVLQPFDLNRECRWGVDAASGAPRVTARLGIRLRDNSMEMSIEFVVGATDRQPSPERQSSSKSGGGCLIDGAIQACDRLTQMAGGGLVTSGLCPRLFGFTPWRRVE